ncbi:MAG: putative O-glycosylation ligase, exosortase A system-associated [Thermomicrobiales bacterium]|jgi:probable O-glycosylation ligase (exosortase A-associated)|nr:putative O-glycosylation ligase, exosortase A system-associated [Thermomicrobiales bacterium]MCL4738370.1 putative O-glycosylation ligase, exosortase A system-associated [Burkholderiaceae bacterium]
MRDLVLACVVFGALPFVLVRPFWGILMLAWLGYMNPHRLAWGFMFDMPVVQIVAIFTLSGMLLSREAKRMVWSREIVVLVLFVAWMGITTTTAFFPTLAIQQYEKVVKIQILTFMTLLMLTSERKLHLFIWTIALSLGFYGVKGGIFTIVNGGVYRVQGPIGTFIGGNNEIALALVMSIPLMRYLYLQEKRQLIKLGLAAAMFLTAIAAFGTQSRGALIALSITGAIFWVKSRHKFVTAAFVVLAAVVGMSQMPQEWFDRMETIQNYQEDRSAQGRLNQWANAINIANDRIVGGGFETWQRPVCQRYAPNPNDCRDVHSIYFEVLGEHGWIGLAFFLGLLAMMWMKCRSIIRIAKRNRALTWARDLAAMIQVSMVAYMSAGAFLGLAYFDFIYHLLAVVVVASHLVTRTPEAVVSSTRPAGSAPQGATAHP